MKFFTKNKVIAGVIGLIAVVSIVNTQAIVKLSRGTVNNEDYSAQVLTASASKCVEVLPPSENRTSFVDPGSVGSSIMREYIIGIKIKNRCNHPISIIHDRIGKTDGVSDVLTNAIQIVNIQKFSDLANPVETTGAYGFWGPQPIQPGSVLVAQGADISIPPANLTAPSSHLPSQSLNTWASTIPALSTRDFTVYGTVLNANSLNLEAMYVRVSLNKFRWFKTSNYTNDNVLSANEVTTYTFAANSFISSYAKFEPGCAEGTVIGYDSAGNPIYCGDEIGDGDCAEGTIIGYNKDGTPIFCGE